jgi:competence ComEA-like helix-hairpin-helix protein
VSDKDSNASGPLFWTPPQVRGILVLLAILTGILAVRLVCDRAFIDDPQPEVPSRMTDLADRMDPNAATWQELAAIPGLGEKKARAIVAFREKWIQDHPNLPAFAGPQDLRGVKGIGPATVSNMSRYFIFPQTAVGKP